MRKYRVEELRKLVTEETDDCVIPSWGEGIVRINGHNHGCSRGMWILHRGDPRGALVLHTCDNGNSGCVNLRHLYLGDHRANLLDRFRDQGSIRTGLTERDVREIRSRSYEVRGSRVAVAKEYGISKSVLGRIVNRQTWAWVD